MPRKGKKSKSKQTKPKNASASRAKKAPRVKQAKPSRPNPALRKEHAKKKTSSKTSAARKKTLLSNEQQLESSWGRPGPVPGRQSGDLQGLSTAERADSESVDELVEEGNIREAGAVAGVQEADNADEREVHTHQVPEDDVPDEYLDKD